MGEQVDKISALIDEFMETQEKTNPGYYIQMRRSLSRHIANGLSAAESETIAAQREVIVAQTTTLAGICSHYATALRMLHKTHVPYEAEHCPIVVCVEGRNNLSLVLELARKAQTK
jgi:hypothetical protein